MRDDTRARLSPLVWALAAFGALLLLGPAVLLGYSLLGAERTMTCDIVTVEEVKGERGEVLQRAKKYLTTPGAGFAYDESAELIGASTGYRSGIRLNPGESYPNAQLPKTPEGIQRALDELTVKQSVDWIWASLREGERYPSRDVSVTRWDEETYSLQVNDGTCVPLQDAERALHEAEADVASPR